MVDQELGVLRCWDFFVGSFLQERSRVSAALAAMSEAAAGFTAHSSFGLSLHLRATGRQHCIHENKTKQKNDGCSNNRKIIRYA